MFFNFEVDEPQEDPSSPTVFSPHPISLGRLEQGARNSGFDRIESTETIHVGSEDRSNKNEAEAEVRNGEACIADSGRSEKPAGALMHTMRNSISGWRRKDSWGWYDR